MTKIKLLVSLKIPDTTAITAFHTLERMGFKELKHLERMDYYEFVYLKDNEQFMKDIVQVDILVNANKHFHEVFKAEDWKKDDDFVYVLVKDSGDNAAGLKQVLQERMGFHDITEMNKGVLWKMGIDAADKEAVAEKITKELLCNENYQEFKIL